MKLRARLGLLAAAALLAPGVLPVQAADDVGGGVGSPSLTPHSRMVSVGDYRLHLTCVGTGSPTIVLIGDGFVEDWMRVQPALGSFTRTCTYDRAGLGMSDQGPVTTTVAGLAKELQTLLRRAHVPGPFILVGYALGGSIMRLFASRHTRAVAGLVLIDALHQSVLWHSVVPNSDGIDLGESRRQMESAGSLKSLPLVVVSHGVFLSYPEPVEHVWPQAQRALTRLSTNSLHVIAEHSAHTILFDQFRLVQQAVLQLVLMAHDLAKPRLTCTALIQSAGGLCTR
jgi:pimeloyl-ACP methyl ester carboxylesterase